MEAVQPPGQTAWCDESFFEHDHVGFYILAAAVVEPGTMDTARDAMLGLRGGRATNKLHWTEMEHKQRLTATRTVHGLGSAHLVVIGTPVPMRRQERARGQCLNRLVWELHDFSGVEHLVVEAREPVLNDRDVKTVLNVRHQLPKGTAFRVDHCHGSTEPLLWVADIVAGACRAHRLGDSRYWDIIGENVLDIPLDIR
jgi:Protein of unknown function (DUF3800)